MRPSFENVSSLNGSATLVEARLVAVGLNSDVFSRAIAFVIAALRSGRVEPLALRRREHDVEHGALLGRELGLDQVGRLLRVRARDLELVREEPPIVATRTIRPR